MTKLRSLAPLVLLAFAPGIVLADDYRFEAKGAINRDDIDRATFGEFDTYSLLGTWYFSPVSSDNVPLAEAAYLGRASRVSATAVLLDFDWRNTKLNGQAVDVGYYIPNTMFYAGVGVSHGQRIAALSSTVVEKEYVTTYFGSVGVAPIDGLLITTDFVEGGYDPNLTARYVGKLPNNHFYAGSVDIVDPDQGGVSFGVDFDYYLDETTSLGVGFSDAGHRWELRGEKFFSKSWAAGVSAYTGDGIDGFGVSVTWRH